MDHSVRQTHGQAKPVARNQAMRPIHGGAAGEGPQYVSQPLLAGPGQKDDAGGIGPPPFFPHHHPQVMVPPGGIVPVVPPPVVAPTVALPMPPLLPTPPLPPSQQFGLPQQAANLGELLLTNSLPELVRKVHDLGFPGSCQFVLGLLERYFSSCLSGSDPMTATSQVTRGNLLVLKEMFILRQNTHHHKGQPPMFQNLPPPSMSPSEEICLLMSVYNHLEELSNIELRYCLFDAVFCDIGSDSPTPEQHSMDHGPKMENLSFDCLKKLVSLAINTENSTVLACAALWMQTHPNKALLLANSLYYDFCVLLPDAIEPLMQLASFAPHLANQLTTAFTSLYPFHLVGTVPPGIDSTKLHPPIKLLHIVSHWLEINPDYLYSSPLLSRNIAELPLFHSHSITPAAVRSTSPISRSPLAGIIQWCILTPLAFQTEQSSMKTRANDLELKTGKVSSKTNTVTSKLSKDVPLNSKLSFPNGHEVKDVGSVVAALHASLLSIVLSHSSSSSTLQGNSPALSRDDVAVIVAALLGFRQHTQSTVRKERLVSGRMDECVERLAQFMQIGLSNGMLTLSPDDLTSVASTLPKNRLLDLVVAHCRQTGIKS